MRIQNRVKTLLQAFRRGHGAKTEVEVHYQFTRNDVAGPGAAVHVGHLPAGGGEKLVAGIPRGADQFSQRGSKQMHWIFSQMRIGNVPLHTLDGELAAHGAASAIFDHVAQLTDRRRLADDAVVQHLATRLELVADHHRAVCGRAFLVAGEQKRDRQRRIGMGG